MKVTTQMWKFLKIINLDWFKCILSSSYVRLQYCENTFIFLLLWEFIRIRRVFEDAKTIEKIQEPLLECEFDLKKGSSCE
jgi:hypothetical protein